MNIEEAREYNIRNNGNFSLKKDTPRQRGKP